MTTQTARFRPDNTGSYDADELSELNAAWSQIMSHGGSALEDSDALDAQSWVDHCAETLLAEFDAGKRGDDLVAWYYA